MGYSQSSLAVIHQTPDVILRTLGLGRTGEFEEFPESPLVAATLPGGWFLVVANRAEHEIIHERMLRELSANGEIVTCSVEEHVMVSEATGWRHGRRLWRVLHDAQISFTHLVTEGELPTAFPAIQDRLLTEQQDAVGDSAGVDFRFDIPVELAMSFTGYRHDATTPGLGNAAFEILESNAPKKSLLRRLFGG